MSHARAAGLAWRHVVWFTALLPETRFPALIDELTAMVDDISPRLTVALADLAAACAGTTPDTPLLGWSNGPNPLLASGGSR
ncbi:hypothetical protein [Myceligenerans salitolerans]|uniref:Uncharacterized protein n=1 Tax=Myceligenerans salitolerans TaxID=1230528 RepID=A0ABS3I8M5_9MICO|nr:hypothetical protein [Myceligenerans salitolerans]MBO0609363.1 hypothetical protein [Myceligenerans salitolerans]